MLEESSCPADHAEFNCFNVNMAKWRVDLWLMTNVSNFYVMCSRMIHDPITRTEVGYDYSLLI